MKHICIEGPNGGGKTSIIQNLKSEGYSTLSSPNGTELAKYLRPACRGTDQWQNLSDMVKFLLFSAARCDEFDKLIKNNDSMVICDRWHFSTWVYQCQLGNIPVELYEATISPDEKIDLVILLDGDTDVLVNRVMNERKKNSSHGICSWTKQHSTMIEIIEIYREQLPVYLERCKIPYHIINTTKKNEKQVLELVKEQLREI